MTEEKNRKIRRVPIRYIRANEDSPEAVESSEERNAAEAREELEEALRSDAPDSEGADVSEEDWVEDSPASVAEAEPKSAEALQERLAEALQERLAEVEDRWKRAAADLDNYRKRFEREVGRLQMQERETILRAWLDVVDNMERALCADGASNNPWYEGMEAIHQQMLGVLDRFGVTPDVPMGQKFNPERHDAVATASLPGEPEGKIVDVTQTGYVLKDRVLRPAKVIVVKHEHEMSR